MPNSASNEGLLATFNARLGYALQITEVIHDPIEPYAVFSLHPILPGLSNKLEARGIVWDLDYLIRSCQKQGEHFVLNSDCGYPPDSNLWDAVHVSHTSSNIVVWEIDATDCAAALDDDYAGRNGFIRYVFDRDEYEADVRSMLRVVQMRARTPVEREELGELADGLPPQLQTLPAEEYEPNHGGDLLEHLLKINHIECLTAS